MKPASFARLACIELGLNSEIAPDELVARSSIYENTTDILSDIVEVL